MDLRHLLEEFAGEFDEAAVQFRDGADELVGWLRRRQDLTRTVARVRRDLEDRQAELLIDGVEGKNAEERTAKLRLAVRDDPSASELTDELAKAQADLDTADVEIEAERHRMSAARARRQMAMSLITALTVMHDGYDDQEGGDR